MKIELVDLITEIDKEFIPPLSSRLNIEEYVDKLCYKSTIISICDNGKLNAFVAFYCNDFEKQTAYLSMLAVRKSYRNKGLGELLLRNALSIIQREKFKAFSLEVNKANESAISLYYKFGFVQVGENQNSWFMQKDLI